jgi:hypothetical protein
MDTKEPTRLSSFTSAIHFPPDLEIYRLSVLQNVTPFNLVRYQHLSSTSYPYLPRQKSIFLYCKNGGNVLLKKLTIRCHIPEDSSNLHSHRQEKSRLSYLQFIYS